MSGSEGNKQEGKVFIKTSSDSQLLWQTLLPFGDDVPEPLGFRGVGGKEKRFEQRRALRPHTARGQALRGPGLEVP